MIQFLFSLFSNRYVFMIAVIGFLAFGIKYHYDQTEQTISDLTVENVLLKEDVKNLVGVVEYKEKQMILLEKKIREQQIIEDKLRKNSKEAIEYKIKLINKLTRHDLTYLALSKPGLVEKRINDGTKEIFSDIHSITLR